jgi:hypothetical protein
MVRAVAKKRQPDQTQVMAVAWQKYQWEELNSMAVCPAAPLEVWVMAGQVNLMIPRWQSAVAGPAVGMDYH